MPADRSAAEPDEPVRVTQFDMTVEGAYEQIAGFLSALEQLGGYIRPVTITLTPREVDGRALVEARVACEALSLPLPEVLASIVESSDGRE